MRSPGRHIDRPQLARRRDTVAGVDRIASQPQLTPAECQRTEDPPELNTLNNLVRSWIDPNERTQRRQPHTAVANDDCLRRAEVK